MTAQSSGLTHREAEKWSKGVQSPAPTCSVTFCTWLIKGRDRPPAAPPTPAGQADNSGLALLGVLTQCSFANYKVQLCRFLEPEYDLASDLVDRILAVRKKGLVLPLVHMLHIKNLVQLSSLVSQFFSSITDSYISYSSQDKPLWPMEKEVNMLTSRKGGQRSMHTPPRPVPASTMSGQLPMDIPFGPGSGIGQFSWNK